MSTEMKNILGWLVGIFVAVADLVGLQGLSASDQLFFLFIWTLALGFCSALWYHEPEFFSICSSAEERDRELERVKEEKHSWFSLLVLVSVFWFGLPVLSALSHDYPESTWMFWFFGLPALAMLALVAYGRCDQPYRETRELRDALTKMDLGPRVQPDSFDQPAPVNIAVPADSPQKPLGQLTPDELDRERGLAQARFQSIANGVLGDVMGSAYIDALQSGDRATMAQIEDVLPPNQLVPLLREANEFLGLLRPLGIEVEFKSDSSSGTRSPEHSDQRESRTNQTVKSFGFLSAKGGCGATTLVCHVAAELGRHGHKVLLIDLDLHAGLVGFITKTRTVYSILDAIKNSYRLDIGYWRALVSRTDSGVEILASPPMASVSEQEVKADHLTCILGFVRPHYDWVLIDLGHSLSQLTTTALRELDEACLVTTLEVPALYQCKQIIQTLVESGYEKSRIKLILNRSPKRLDIRPGELEGMLGVPIYSMVPNDYPELYEAYAKGRMLTHDSELGRDIGKLALKLASLEDKEPLRWTDAACSLPFRCKGRI